MCLKARLALVFGALVFSMVVFSSCREKRVVVVDNFEPIDMTKLSIGDTVMPFRFINPAEHDWRIVVRVSGEDLVDLSHKLTTRMFSTTDEEELNRFRNWKFIYRKVGVTDASSTIRVFKNEKLEETYGIVLEKKWIGIQSKKLGLLQSVRHEELLDLLKDMD